MNNRNVVSILESAMAMMEDTNKVPYGQDSTQLVILFRLKNLESQQWWKKTIRMKKLYESDL